MSTEEETKKEETKVAEETKEEAGATAEEAAPEEDHEVTAHFEPVVRIVWRPSVCVSVCVFC
jgi:hypothetical protein